MAGTAYLNGVYVAREEARISPFDRGFLFADAAYEVTAVYGGQPIDLSRHLDRLQRSLSSLGFAVMPDRAELERVHTRLIADNDLSEGSIYLQVSRGAYAGRDFPAPQSPEMRLTVFAFAEAKALVDQASARDGIKIISVPDLRWARRDIKSTGLLAQALAKTEAKRQGADDAWLVGADGWITEGASANAWIVAPSGELVTRDVSNAILAGVTRHKLMDRLADRGLNVVERPFTLAEAKAAAEAFSTSATALVAPVVGIDGGRVGAGRPGPTTRAVQRLYFEAIGADPDRLAWLRA